MHVLPSPDRRASGSLAPLRSLGRTGAGAVRAGMGFRMVRAAVFTAVCVVLSAGGHALASCAPVPLWTLAAGCLAVFAVVVASAGRERTLPQIAGALAIGQLALHTLFALGQHGTAMAAAGPAPGSGAGSGSYGRMIQLASKLLCDSGPQRLTPLRARRIVTDAGLDPASGGAQAASGAHGAHAGHADGYADRIGQTWHAVAAPHTSLMDALLPSPVMVLGHLLAALAAGWLLRRGEAALWQLVRLSTDGVCVRALRTALRLARALRTRLLGEDPADGVRVVRADGRGVPEPCSVALQHSVIRRGPPRFALAA